MYTPQNKKNKRTLADTSPDMENQAQVGTMTVEQLMTVMKASFSGMMDELVVRLPTKEDVEDIKCGVINLTASVEVLQKENAELREEIEKLKDAKGESSRRIVHLEDDLKRKNLVVRGMEVHKYPMEAVSRLLEQKMQIQPPLQIETARKIYESHGKMGVVVEFGTKKAAQDVLRQTKKLAGTEIYIEKDLSAEKRVIKKVMLRLRRDILAKNSTKRVNVRDDKLLIEGKWFYWSESGELMSEKKGAMGAFKQIYGDNFEINLEYSEIHNRAQAKNF